MRFYQISVQLTKSLAGVTDPSKPYLLDGNGLNSHFSAVVNAGLRHLDQPLLIGQLVGMRRLSLIGITERQPFSRHPPKHLSIQLIQNLVQQAFNRTTARVTLTETTMTNALNAIKMAGRHGIIDDDDVLTNLGLDELATGWHRAREHFSNIPRAQHALCAAAAHTIYPRDLQAELPRIFAAAKTKLTVKTRIPIHYMIAGGDDKFAQQAMSILISAQYSMHRLTTRRTLMLDLNRHAYLDQDMLDQIFGAAVGGALYINADLSKYRFDDADDAFSAGINSDIDALLAHIKQFRDSVLIILHIAANGDPLTKYIKVGLGGLTFFTLSEQRYHTNAAKSLLGKAAKRIGLTADQALLQTVKADTRYSRKELEAYFTTWRRAQLKTTIFPQYHALASLAVVKAKLRPTGNAYAELQALIGLDSVKREIDKVIATQKYNAILKGRHLVVQPATQHLVFTGDPGTAKTTVARLYARIMKANGNLSQGHLVEVGQSDLVGKYVGQTAPLVAKAFAKAKGSVLFIDEAYSLARSDNGGYGQEAIDAIVKEMENTREDTAVIFAGYPNEMATFMAANPGLCSRINTTINFPDYDVAQLVQIAHYQAHQFGLTIAPAANARLTGLLTAAKAKSPGDFGNGRAVRNLIEQARQELSLRLLSQDTEKLSDATLTTILPADLLSAASPELTHTNTIGLVH